VAHDAEVEPAGEHVAELTKLARVDHLPDAAHRTVVEEGVADHEHPVALCSKPAQLLGFGDGPGERLLHQDVTPRLQHRGGDRGMRRHRRGHHHRLDPVVGEHRLQLRGAAGQRGDTSHPHQRGGIRVAHPAELEARALGEGAGEVDAPVAAPHQGDVDHAGHQGASPDGWAAAGSMPASRR